MIGQLRSHETNRRRVSDNNDISQLLRDSFSVSQQPPIWEPPSHYSMLGGGDSSDPHYLQSLHKTDDDKTYLHFGKQSMWTLIQNIRCRDKKRSFFLNHLWNNLMPKQVVTVCPPSSPAPCLCSGLHPEPGPKHQLSGGQRPGHTIHIIVIISLDMCLDVRYLEHSTALKINIHTIMNLVLITCIMHSSKIMWRRGEVRHYTSVHNYCL